MKRTMICLTLFLSVAQVFGQDSVVMDVDTTIFNKHLGYTTYQSESTDANISCIIFPMSYDRSLPGMQHESNSTAVILEEKEMMIHESRIYTKKGKVTIGEEQLIIETYLIEVSEEKSLLVIGRYGEQYTQIVGESIKNAATSARLIE